MTHEQLVQWAWGRERRGETALVRNVVKKLRGKLGDSAGTPQYYIHRAACRLPDGQGRRSGTGSELNHNGGADKRRGGLTSITRCSPRLWTANATRRD